MNIYIIDIFALFYINFNHKLLLASFLFFIFLSIDYLLLLLNEYLLFIMIHISILKNKNTLRKAYYMIYLSYLSLISVIILF